MKNSKNRFSGWLDTWRTPSKPTLGSVKYSFQELSTNPKLARKCFKQIIGVYIEYKPGAKKLKDMTDAEVLSAMKIYLESVTPKPTKEGGTDE